MQGGLRPCCCHVLSVTHCTLPRQRWFIYRPFQQSLRLLWAPHLSRSSLARSRPLPPPVALTNILPAPWCSSSNTPYPYPCQVGGIQSVTLGDDEARRRGVQKSILERAGPPTFDVCIEMLERCKWRVHLDVGQVGAVGAGGASWRPAREHSKR